MSNPNDSTNWYAIQVQSRYERSTEAALRGRGFQTFLPLQQVRRYWSDRIKEIDLPLFPGYLFCSLDSGNWLPILQTPGVLQIVGTGRTPVPVDEEEFLAVRALVQSGIPAEPWPFLTAGNTVRIVHGPLAGLEGIVVETKSHYRLVVSLTILKRAVSAEIDSAWVEQIRIPVASSGYQERSHRVAQ